ncbi:MAG: DUF4139 domain-containing protein [Kiloniellales bacterium]
MDQLRMIGAPLRFAILLCATLFLATSATGAAERPVGLEAQRALTVTIYNRDLALISDERLVDFAAGENRIALRDVSARLRPETVILSGAGLALVEQGFEADLLGLPRLLEEALGERVWVRRGEPGQEHYVEAELVSIALGPLVRLDGRLEGVTPDRLAFAAGEQGLRDRPTLVATLLSEVAGERALGLSYLSGGLSWQADYVAALNAAEDRLDLTGLVTLSNDSGTVFKDARLRLVAGEVNQAATPPMPMARAQMDLVAMAEAAPKMAEHPVGEQHLYTLERPVTLGRRETKQVTLLSGEGLPVSKEYRFEELVNAYGGAEEIGPLQAAVALEFKNEGVLGKPLPAGVLRVYQEAPDGGDDGGAPVFIGEDRIEHTAEGETVRITTGRAFDVTGEARQTVFERISSNAYDSGQAITVRNAKDRAVTVAIVGQLPRGWRMLEESLPHEAETANRIVWQLPVPAGGEATLSYRVRITNP